MPTQVHSRHWLGVGLLAIGHGLGDFNAGVLLAALGDRSGADLVMLYLLYNVLAFAGQPLAGFVCDRMGRMRLWFGVGGGLSALSLLLAGWNPVAAVICAGVASAFYHAAGGAVAWELGGRRTLAAALFSAPGVVGLAVGLAVGARLSFGQMLFSGAALGLVLAALGLVLRGVGTEADRPDERRARAFGVMGSIVGWVIIVAIAARSFAWSAGQQAIFPADYAVALAVAAALGKAVAGMLADRVGAGRITVVSLMVAVVCLWAGKVDVRWFFPAVVCLQAATGPMMALVFKEWPRYPALASGLAQGLAIALGALPLLVISSWGAGRVEVVAFAVMLAAGLAWWTIKGRKELAQTE